MMTYLQSEVLLLQNNKDELKENIREALKNLLESYNKVYMLAIHQQKYIKEKRPEFAREMEENFRLIERNKYLEDTVKRYKELNKSEMQYSKELEKELRMTKKLLEEVLSKTNSRK